MAHVVRHDKQGWTKLREGTKIHTAVELLLRPQGVTNWEATQIIGSAGKPLTGLMAPIEDQFGYIVKSFPCPTNRLKPLTACGLKRGRREFVYKIVGRCRWDGSGIDDYMVPLLDVETMNH